MPRRGACFLNRHRGKNGCILPESRLVRKFETGRGGNVSTTKATDDVKTTDGVQETYRVPKVLAIGKAVHLLQGLDGKYSDAYAGWYMDPW